MTYIISAGGLREGVIKKKRNEIDRDLSSLLERNYNENKERDRNDPAGLAGIGLCRLCLHHFQMAFMAACIFAHLVLRLMIQYPRLDRAQ